MQSMVSCSRPGGETVSLPILGRRGRALIQEGWRVEARDDGAFYALHLLPPSDASIEYRAKGETWAQAWELLEQSIQRLDGK
jgi:hypothetical protein